MCNPCGHPLYKLASDVLGVIWGDCGFPPSWQALTCYHDSDSPVW